MLTQLPVIASRYVYLVSENDSNRHKGREYFLLFDPLHYRKKMTVKNWLSRVSRTFGHKIGHLPIYPATVRNHELNQTLNSPPLGPYCLMSCEKPAQMKNFIRQRRKDKLLQESNEAKLIIGNIRIEQVSPLIIRISDNSIILDTYTPVPQDLK